MEEVFFFTEISKQQACICMEGKKNCTEKAGS